MSTLVKKHSVKAAPKSHVKPTFTNFYVKVFSRHPSVQGLRKKILIKGKSVVFRHGSTTEGNFKYEINSVQSVKTSADKLQMKRAFDKAGVKHAKWIEMGKHGTEEFKKFLSSVEFPDNRLIVKHRFGSRGTGNYLITNKEELARFTKDHAGSLGSYIAEEYKNYSVEYRLHVTKRGYFYTCRKMLKTGTPADKKFQRHDDNCKWFVETNPDFNKPNNWNEIVADCIKALESIGADVLAFDVKCTSKKNSKDGNVNWILIESCSAPSFGDKTLQNYIQEIPKIIAHKYNV